MPAYVCPEHGMFRSEIDRPRTWCPKESTDCCGNIRPCGMPSELVDYDEGPVVLDPHEMLR